MQAESMAIARIATSLYVDVTEAPWAPRRLHGTTNLVKLVPRLELVAQCALQLPRRARLLCRGFERFEERAHDRLLGRVICDERREKVENCLFDAKLAQFRKAAGQAAIWRAPILLVEDAH